MFSGSGYGGFPCLLRGDQRCERREADNRAIAMKKKILFYLVCSIMALQGCSGEADNNSHAEVPIGQPGEMSEAEKRAEKKRRVFNPTAEERAADQAEREAREAAARAKDPIKWSLAAPLQHPSFENYAELESGAQLLFLYNSLRDTRDDALTIAESFEYGHFDRRIVVDEEFTELLKKLNDARSQFDRNDLVPTLDEAIDQRISAHRNIRHLKVEFPKGDLLSPYDFDKQGFATKTTLLVEKSNLSLEEKVQRMQYGSRSVPDRAYLQWSDNSNYTFVFSNGVDFNFFSVPNEADARVIEDYIQNRKEYLLIGYGFVDELTQGKDVNTDKGRELSLSIQRLDIVDAKDKSIILATNVK